MAIYHLHAKMIQRAKGKNVVAAAAYRRATKMLSEAEGRAFNYTRKRNVIYREVILPKNAPAWLTGLASSAMSRDGFSEKLWNLVEGVEKRKDAQLARELEFALPIELNEAQNIALAREFVHDQFALRGMVADLTVHWDKGNPHCHVLLSTREITAEGFGRKTTAWNNRALLSEWRAKWAEYANYHLKLQQCSVRIDHRSYAEQGIGLAPGIHEGKAVHDMGRRGIATDVMQTANAIRQENFSRIQQSPEALLHKISGQQETFTLAEVSNELGRYAAKSTSAIPVEMALEEEGTAWALPGETLGQILSTIEAHESVFTERSLAQALAGHIDDADAFAKALIAIKASPELICLGAGDDGRDRFTTRRMFKLENALQQTAEQLHNKRHLSIPAKKSRAALENYQRAINKQLTAEQLNAVGHIVKGTRSIACMVGRAGTGKSFSLGAAKAIWEACGLQVFGVALSGIAADGLAQEASIPSQTIEAFKLALHEGRLKLCRNAVVVMDEAGMADTQSMLAVAKAVAAVGAKLVLVGDPAQVQPVGPGAPFRALIERLGFAEIQTVYRQKIAWQRTATRGLSAGDTQAALALYAENGLMHLSATEEDSLARLANDWLNCTRPLSERLAIAHRNEDVAKLNAILRAGRIERGEIADGYEVQAVIGKIKIAKGDRLLFLRNHKALGISNGRFATIAAVEFTETGKVVRFTAALDGSGQEVTIDPRRYPHFALGYAATVHKVQGMTVDEAFVYAGGKSWDRHLTYVALSRHRYHCQLYADQTTHKEKAQLFKALGRLGIKDSLLDFPLAFAQRRGLDTSQLAKILPKHLAGRLSGWAEQLRARYQQWRDPEGQCRQQEEALERMLKAETQAKVREDARRVAAYVDAHRAMGKAWQDFTLQLEKFGLKKIDYSAGAFAAIAATPAFQGLQNALNDRNALAAAIVECPERYQKALEIYALDLAVLDRQAESHACFLRVQAYLKFKAQGATVLRDRLAAQIYEQIKAHYAHLKNQGIDARILRQEAKAHVRRQLLCGLSRAERKGLFLVESYRRTSAEIGAYYAQHIGFDKILAREKLIAFEALKNKRDQLAHEILQMREICAKTLDFYQIGTPADERQIRWYKLQGQAARHELRARIENYFAACRGNNASERMRLATEIRAESKAHYGAMRQLGIAPQEGLWLQLWQDDQRCQRWQHFKKLDLIERAAFLTVEAYVEAKRAHAVAWRELLASKAAQNMGNATFYQRLAVHGRAYTKARDKLAAEIASGPLAYQTALEYFKINIEELNAQAQAHACQLRVDHFASTTSVIKRATIAVQIAENPKAHVKAMAEKGASWQAIYRLAHIAERQKAFQQASFEEKRLLRAWNNYQKISRKAGQQYAKQKSRGAVLPGALALIAKRDALAHRVLELRSSLAFLEICEGQQANAPVKILLEKNHFPVAAGGHTVKIAKLEKQARAHLERKQSVQAWQERYQASLQQLGEALRGKSDGRLPEKFLHSLLDWAAEREDTGVAALGQQIIKESACYGPALQEAGLPLAQLRRQQQMADALLVQAKAWHGLTTKTPTQNEQMPALSWEDQKRINIVRGIVRQCRPIANTLAECYLRERRGISCPLNDKTFYYHPHLKNWMTGSVHPALVIVARDAQQRPCGLQAIFLDPVTAKKADLGGHTKLSRGLTREGALVQQGESGGKVAFAEGPETALAVAEAKPDWTVYCTFGVRNFDKVPLKTQANSVVIAADNDGVRSGTERAIEEAARKLAKQGKDVWVALPEKPAQIKKWDFNDALLKDGRGPVAKCLDGAKLTQRGANIERSIEGAAQLAGQMIGKVDKKRCPAPQVPLAHEARLVDMHDLLSVLKCYVEQEIEQAALARAMHLAKAQGSHEGKEASLKAIKHNEGLLQLAADLAQHPAVREEALALKCARPMPLAERGGYMAIHERFAAGEFAKEDMQSVIKQIQSKAARQSRERQQGQDRGGRSH